MRRCDEQRTAINVIPDILKMIFGATILPLTRSSYKAKIQSTAQMFLNYKRYHAVCRNVSDLVFAWSLD